MHVQTSTTRRTREETTKENKGNKQQDDCLALSQQPFVCCSKCDPSFKDLAWNGS